MSTASRDSNFVTTLLAVSSVDGVTPVTLYANPTTHRLLVDLAGGGSGTVQTISIATANGFAGTSDGDPADPTLTLTTTVTGILKGDGTAISAITVGSGLSYDGTTLSATGGGSGITWSEVTGTSQAGAVNSGYILNNAGLVTLTIPTTAAVGDIVRVVGKGAGGWLIAQNASENINFGSVTTTTGVGGSLASTNRYDCVELVCTVADTTWTVMSSVGNITVV